MKLSLRLALGVLLSAAIGCATRPPVTEAPAATAGEQWSRLQQHSRGASGYRSYSRVQWEDASGRRVSFDATIVTDGAGNLLLEALTPVGTAAATLWSDGNELVFLNHRANTWWQGALGDVPSASPVIPALRAVGVDAAAKLLFGFPVAGDSSGCTSGYAEAECRVVGGVAHEVSPSGLLRVTTGGVEISYEEPSVPATRVKLRAPTGVLTILHRAIESSDESIERPQAPAAWRCCVLPGFE